MGTKMAVKGAAAGIIGGPALAGLAGGLATGVRVGVSLQFEGKDILDPEELGESSVAKIHERYVMKQKRRAEKGGKINRALTLLNAPEKWAVEKTFKTEEREKMIDEQLLALGIGIKADEQGKAYLETTDGRKISEILTQADTPPENPNEKSQLDILIQRMAVQGRLAGHSSSTMEGMRDVKKELFLQACAIKGENDPSLLEATLEAAKAEFGTKEKLATTGMLAGISAAKSAFKGAIGVALAESVIGENIEETIEKGIEFVGAKFEYAAESLKDTTEQLAVYLGKFREYGTQLVNALRQREEARKGLEQVIKLTSYIRAIKGVEETLGSARLVAENVRAIDIETLDVEVPSGSTVGQELLTSLQSNGEGINIWDESSADVWGAMVFENQDDGFFLDAIAMAKSAGDEQWLQFANELGLDETTGQFDKEAILSLVEKAKGGDREAFQKLYRMFHWVRAGEHIGIPTNIHTLLETGLSHVEATDVTLEPVTESITTIVENTALTDIPMTEAALEAEIMGQTLTEADAKTQALMESIRAITGSRDPVADMLDRVEDLGDKIGDMEGLIGPVAERIEELTEKIEDTYQDIGGIETLANAYYRVRGIIENEPEFLEKLSELEGTTESAEMPEDSVAEGALQAFKEAPLTYLGLAVAGRWMFGGKKRWRSSKNRNTQTTAPRTQTPPATQPTNITAQADALTNLADSITVGNSREAQATTPVQSRTVQSPQYIPGQFDFNTTSTLEPGYDVEFTYGDTPENNMGMAEDNYEIDQLKRQRQAEQQRLADEAIMEAYREREQLLNEYRDKGVIPFYREVIDFKPVDVEGINTRKIPVPKVELLGTSEKIDMEGLRITITNEVRQEIIAQLQKEDPDFDYSKDTHGTTALQGGPVGRRACNLKHGKLTFSVCRGIY